MAPADFVYAIKAVGYVATPLLFVRAFAYVIERILDKEVPGRILWLAYALTLPALVFARSILDGFKHEQEARARGAVQVPIWSGKLTWLGSIDLLVVLVKQFHEGYPAEPFWTTIQKLGTIFNVRILGQNQIITFEPEHIKQILATEFHNFEKGDPFRHAMRSVLGSGVFNADGEMWKFHRSMTRPFFSRDRISHFTLFEKHTDTALELISQRLREGIAVDIQDVLARFTLDSATEFLFGKCVHSLEAGGGLPYPHNISKVWAERKVDSESDVEKFVRAYAESQIACANRVRVGTSWPLLELFEDKTAAPMKIVNAYLDPILKEALTKKGRSKSASSSPIDDEKDGEDIEDDETLLDHLVKYTDDHKFLRDEILNILIAGRDTTAGTLTFAIYALAMYPDISSRLRSEILDKVGSTSSPTYDDIKEMKYLRAFINETLRVYPVVPFNMRHTVKATTFPPTTPGGKPFYIPAATNVSYSVLVMQRRTDLWGPDAMEFDPDRFLDERLQKYLIPNPFIFVPFNAGPRICLGQQFAYNEVSFMLIRLLQRFSSFTLCPSAQPPDSTPPPSWKDVPGRQSVDKVFPSVHLTMHAKGGLWVTMSEAIDTNATAT